jgi:excisionase family DNA binding protein
MQKGFFVGALVLLLAVAIGAGSFAGADAQHLSDQILAFLAFAGAGSVADGHPALPEIVDAHPALREIVLAAAPVAAAKVEAALYTIPQACEILCIGRSTAYALIGRGNLDAVRLPGLNIIRVTRESVERLLGAAIKADIAPSKGSLKTTLRRLAHEAAAAKASA